MNSSNSTQHSWELESLQCPNCQRTLFNIRHLSNKRVCLNCKTLWVLESDLHSVLIKELNPQPVIDYEAIRFGTHPTLDFLEVTYLPLKNKPDEEPADLCP